MFGIYIIGVIMVWAISGYFAGRYDIMEDGFLNELFSSESEIIGVGFIFGLLWPAAILGVICLGPFIWIYKLGEKRRAKARAKRNSASFKK